MKMGGILAVAGTALTVTGSILAGAFWLDDRHAKDADVRDLAGYVTKSQHDAYIRHLTAQLRWYQIQGLCQRPEYRAVCVHLSERIREAVREGPRR
jgi:hypothetical protein